MKPYYEDAEATVYHGDCLDVLATLPDASVHAVVTDPPYGLEFMGREWDRFAGKVSDRDFKGFVLSQQRTRNVKCPDCERWTYDHPGRACECGGVRRAQVNAFGAWCEQWTAECLRVLKPGGHLLAFGGTRTWHRLACAVEDAGFEVRDSLAWLYGSGFPKSLDVSKAIDKAAGAEREVVGTGENWGRSRLADGKTAFGDYEGNWQVTVPATPDAQRWQGWGTALKPAFEPIVVARKPLAGTVAGNVLQHGTGALNVDGCRVGDDTSRGDRYNGKAPGGSHSMHIAGSRDQPWAAPAGRWPANVVLDESQAAALDAQSGTLTSGANPTRRGSDKFRDAYGEFAGQEECIAHRGADSGGASRFFYTAKAPTDERPRVDGVAHPTVKPLSLMRWLVRLVTPPHGIVLDPFAGTGTTAEACIHEHFRCIAIEREDAYLPLIVARLTKPMQVGFDFTEADMSP